MSATPLSADEIIELLGLVPLDFEGGWYAETWRSTELLDAAALPERYGAPRPTGTAIYYLLTPSTFSRIHRLKSDEVFHAYLGDPVEMLQLRPDGGARIVVLGADLYRGARPQVVVPAGTWQGARLKPGGTVALLGCTLAPGFDRADFEAGRRSELLARWPERGDLIRELTEPD